MAGPSLVIGGAQKAGTTALFYLLAQHPDVFVPAVKEPGYFSAAARPYRFEGPGAAAHEKGVISARSEYEDLFRRGAGHRHRLEASTTYMAQAGAAEQIYDYDPSIRLIFVLRDPVQRAFSAFNYLRQMNLEPLDSLEQAIEAEPERLAAHWPHSYGYLTLSRYAELLAPYLEAFPREQLLLLGYRQLRDDPAGTLERVERFADLDSFSGYDIGATYNPSGKPRSRAVQALMDLRLPRLRGRLRQALPDQVHRWVVTARDWNIEAIADIDPELRQRLIEELRPQIEATRELAGNDIVEGWTRG